MEVNRCPKKNDDDEEDSCSATGYLIGMIICWVLSFFIFLIYYFNVVKTTQCLKKACRSSDKLKKLAECQQEYNNRLGVELGVFALFEVAAEIGVVAGEANMNQS